MEQETKDVERYKEVLKILDQAIKSGPWDKSLFLQATGKKLLELRTQFIKQTHLDIEKLISSEEGVGTGTSKKREDQIEVFISLYNAAGQDVKSWERMLNTLGANIVSRPILKTEQDVRELVRSKVNKKNEAYVVAYVTGDAFLPQKPNHVPHDALGHELLMLKSDAISLRNIARFVHISGIYELEDGFLTLIEKGEDSDFI